ncbi:MAG: efflux RND transporter permease subunit [Acidobacteriota bacterium]
MTRSRGLGLLVVAGAGAGLLFSTAARDWIRRWIAPDRVRVAIVLTAPGQGREAVLQSTTIPAEEILRGWSAVRSVLSTTEAGEARLEVLTDVDENTALLGTRRRLAAGRSGANLQSLVADPGASGSPAELDVAIVGGDVVAASSLALGTLAPALQAIDRVTRVEIYGAMRLGASVEPRAADLMAHDLTAGELAARLCALGVEQDAGRIRDGATLRPLVVRERIRSLAELAAVQIPSGDPVSGRFTLLTDLARIEISAASDGTAFRVGSEAAVLVRVFGAPSVVSRSMATIGRISLPRPLRILTRAVDLASELAYETLSSTPSPETAAVALRAVPGELARESWSLWVFDARRHATTYAAVFHDRSQWRGRLWLASAIARGAAADSLAQHGLRTRPAQSGKVLWLSAPDPLRLRALLARVRIAEAHEMLTELRDSPPEARRVLRLRADLGSAERAAIEGDLDAAFGRRECGQVEIPGIASQLELLATTVPRTELLPVRPIFAHSAVPLGALGDLAAESSDEAPTLRWDGWPARRLSFAQSDAAQRIVQALVLGPAERAEVETSPATE